MARAPMAETIRILKQETAGLTKALIVETAKREHQAVMRQEPRPSSFTRIVDGAAGASEELVKANGIIVYQYQRIDEIVQFALETLFDLSPVKSGDYRNGHRIVLDGQPVANMTAWHPGADVAITNTLPYARKIEVGKMTMKVSGTSKVYAQARRKVLARFGNIVNVEFTYRGVVGGQQIDASNFAPSLKRMRNNKGRFLASGGQAHNQADLRYPCLVIRDR